MAEMTLSAKVLNIVHIKMPQVANASVLGSRDMKQMVHITIKGLQKCSWP